MAIKSGVHMVKNRLPEVMRSIHELANQDVLVGYPADTGEAHEGQAPIGPNTRTGGITNAQLGYIHEHGAPEANIPARPHLLPGVRDAKEKIAGHFRQAGKAALDGDEGKVDRAMHAAGLSAQSSVRHKIRTGPFAPLQQATIRRRMTRKVARRRGIHVDPLTGLLVGALPLIDTAQMLHAVSYVVRSKK